VADEKCLAKAKDGGRKAKTRAKAFSLIRFARGDAIRRSQQCEEKLFARNLPCGEGKSLNDASTEAISSYKVEA
jgi:hypothetical protein